MAYEDILKKYKVENTPDITVPEIKIRQIDALENNPYKSVVENIQFKKRKASFEEGTRNTEKSMEPDGILKTVKDIAFAVPGAAVDMTQFAAAHPIQAARGVIGGALDFGPVAANTAIWMGRSIKDFLSGKESVGEAGFRLPKPSETLADYLDYERSPEEQALSEATTQYAGYATGEGIFKAMGLGKTAVNIAGDITGGQIVSESENIEERATQAVFDGLFGTAQMVGGKLFRTAQKAKAKPEIEGGTVTEIKGGEVKTVEGAPKTEVKAGDVSERPKTAYVSKADLGVDGRGKKIMATTEVDTKTGDAVVYYAKDLDANPELRQLVWDFEEPHILDKRLSQTGDSFTPNLANISGNISVIEKALGSFAKRLGQNVDEVATQLQKDIQLVAKNNKVITEQFADAFGLYKNKPELVIKKAPTLAKFFQHQLVEPRYSTKISTVDSIEAEIGKPLKSFEKRVPNDPVQARTQALKDKLNSNREMLKGTQRASKGKADGMKISAIERKLRGNPTSKELASAIKYLNTNYTGKKVTVDGRPATVTGKTSFGKSEVVFEDNTNKFVSKESIKATKATKEEALKNLKDTATRELESQEAIYGIEKPKANKEVKKSELGTGEKPPVSLEDLKIGKNERISFNLEKGTVHVVDASVPYSEGRTIGNFKDYLEFDTAKALYLAKKNLNKQELEGDIASQKKADEKYEKVRQQAIKQVQKKILEFQNSKTGNIPPQEIDKVKEVKEKIESKKAEKAEVVKEKISYKEWLKTNPEAIKRSKDLIEQSKTIPNAKNRAKFLKEEKSKFDSEFSNKYSKVGGKPSKFSATSLDTGKRVEKLASFNPNTIDAPEDVEILFGKMDAESKNFGSQRISKSNEDLKDLSRMVGLTEDELIKLDPGSIANSETLVAARQIVLNKASDLSNKLKGIDTSKASLEQKAEVRDSFVQLLAMQKSVAGLRTESSNVLRSFGVKLRPGENIAIDELIANLKKLGIDDIDPNDMKALSEAAGKIAKDMELSTKEKLGKGLLQTWYASILSGPKTTVRNVLSTSANILSDMTSKTFMPGQWKEIIPAFKGLVKGWKESDEVGGLKKIFTLEATDPTTGKFYETVDALEGKEVFSGPFAKFGRLVEIPGRILNRQDVRFRAAAEQMEKASLAVYNPKISEGVMKAITEEYGTSLVYRGTPKGRIVEGLAEMSLTFLKKVPEGRLIMPFVQTVANVMDRQFDYIPLTSMVRLTDTSLMRQVEKIAKDAGITETTEKQIILKRLRDQQLGRMSMGLAATAGVVALAKNGMVSGAGPSNYSERIQLQRTGWRPNSIKIGNLWVPYTYLGPMAGVFALGGNIHDKIKYEKSDDKELSEIIGNGIVGWMRTQLNSSFLSGPADLIDVLTNRKRWKDYTDEFIASKVPIPQALTQSIDISKSLIGLALGDDSYKQQYETRGIINKLRKNLGLTGDIGIADALNPRYDQFGTPMTSDLIFGITPSEDKSEAMKLDSFLLNNNVVVSIPVYTKQYKTPTGETRKLTEDEYSAYVRKSGKDIYRTLNDALPALETMPEEAVQKQVKKIVSDIRERVRSDLLYN